MSEHASQCECRGMDEAPGCDHGIPRPDLRPAPLVEQIAAVLAEHIYMAGSDGRGCTCGWRRAGGDLRPLQEQWAEKHLASQLARLVVREKASAWNEGHHVRHYASSFGHSQCAYCANPYARD